MNVEELLTTTITKPQTRVLVVDDERVIRETLAEFLTMEGFHVVTAENGQRALTALAGSRFHVVLCDLKMPVLGGMEVIKAIQQRYPGITTIMMTGFGTVETAIDAMKAGAYDYILKPFKMDEVVHTVRRAVEKKRLEAENLRLRESLSLYKVSEAISVSLSTDEVVRTLSGAILGELRADRALVVVDGVHGPTVRHDATRFGLHLDRPVADVDLRAIAHWLDHEPHLRANELDVRRFVVRSHELCYPVTALLTAPLRVRGERKGFACALSYAPGAFYEEAQRKLLTIIADRSAAAIENARLYQDLESTFRQTIRGLASAIDKMDRYTAGHSERVANYSELLSRRLQLSEQEVEFVRQSAFMHDIGKIGCVMNLNKPGKLSEQEYDVFRQHPGHGRDILEPITFLHPLIPGVHLHHERFDGKGYPLGMRGKEIPLMARIISVADTYDAMTSNRAYRRALPHEVSINEIRRCRGSQFDPDVASEFEIAINKHRHDEHEHCSEHKSTSVSGVVRTSDAMGRSTDKVGSNP